MTMAMARFNSCLVLITVLIPSTAFLFDSVGVVRPVNPYAFIGDTLNLTCNVTDHSKFPGNVSESLYFVHVNGTEEIVLPSEYISVLDPRSILLAYPVTSGMDQGGYTCLINKTSGKAEVINSQTITVEHRPLVVKEIDTVVHDWLSMTTTWKLGQEYVNPRLVDVQLVWTIHGSNGYKCLHRNKTSCTWKEDDGRDSFKNVPYYMYINVTTYKQEGSDEIMDQSTTGWFTVNTKHLVKPAPVERLTVVDKNSTCISLSWQHSQNSKLRTLDNRVLVMQGRELKQNTSTQDAYITLCDLKPDTVHNFMISCIPIPYNMTEPRGYYSDWRDIEGKTLEDIPSAAPKMAAGSFRFHGCEGRRCEVTVYWQPVAKNDSNGEITGYQLRLYDNTGKSQQYDVPGSSRSHDFHIHNDKEYRVEITARTAIGYSKMTENLTIPALEDTPPSPSHFLVETQTNLLNISWIYNTGTILTGYTLYYCHGPKSTFKCVWDDIHWIPLSANQTFFELEMTDVTNILVGISAENELSNKMVSSGITWSPCLYVRDGLPNKLANIRFPPEQPDSALRVEWDTPECTGNTPYVMQYTLTYCEASQDVCTGRLEEQNISSSQHRTQNHVIKDLRVGVSYRVTLRAVSRSGEGPESDPITRKVVTTGLSSAEISGIAIAGAFVFIMVLAVGVFIARRMYRSVKHMKYNIDLPRMVGETDEMPEPPPYRTIPSLSHATTDEPRKTAPPECEDNSRGVEVTDTEKTEDPVSLTNGYSVDSVSSSTTSSTNDSATSTTQLIPDRQHKQKPPSLRVNITTTASLSSETTNPDYKSHHEMMRNDSSETSSTVASYSKVATSYTPSPASPDSYMSDSSQSQLIPGGKLSPTLNEGHLPHHLIKEAKSTLSPTLNEVHVPHHIIKEAKAECSKGAVQNSDYVRYDQKT